MTAELIARAITGLSVTSDANPADERMPRPVAPAVSGEHQQVAVAAALGLAGAIGLVVAVFVALALTVAPDAGIDARDQREASASYAGMEE